VGVTERRRRRTVRVVTCVLVNLSLLHAYILVDLPTVRRENLLHACASNHKMMIINGKDAETNKCGLTKILPEI
jgi:hypothetical protein